MTSGFVATAHGDPPSVSCVIIFFNEQRFLAEAIESILEQTHSDWELLLIDDGSTDNSATIAQEIAAMQPGKIRYLCHEGRATRGKSASRNLGLREARGELVAFLDGDDVWLPDKLEKQVRIFEEQPAAQLICGATEYWHSWDRRAPQNDRVRLTGEVDGDAALTQDRLYPPGSLLTRLYPIARGVTPSQSGYVVRRQFALDLGGFEDTFKLFFEDLLFLTKVFFHGSVFVSSQCFDRYRQHDASSSHAVSRADWAAAKQHYLEWLMNYLRVQGADRALLQKGRSLVLRHRYPFLGRCAAAITRRLHPPDRHQRPREGVPRSQDR